MTLKVLKLRKLTRAAIKTVLVTILKQHIGGSVFLTICSGKFTLNILLRSKTATAKVIRRFSLKHDQIITINIVYTTNRNLIEATPIQM